MKTYTVQADGCGEKTLDQVAEEIEMLAQALRRRSDGTIQTAEAIMYLAADIKADAEDFLPPSPPAEPPAAGKVGGA